MRLWPRKKPALACAAHTMRTVAAHYANIPSLAGVAVEGTAVLQRCNACGKAESFLMPGRWSLAQLTGEGLDVEKLIADSVAPR